MAEKAETKHKVYRAIEGWAHGLPGFLGLEWAVLGCVVLSCFAVMAAIAIAASAPIGGAVLLSLMSLFVAVALLFLLRRFYDGRREAVQLMLGGLSKKRGRHRILDADAPYRPRRPYALQADVEAHCDPSSVLDG